MRPSPFSKANLRRVFARSAVLSCLLLVSASPALALPPSPYQFERFLLTFPGQTTSSNDFGVAVDINDGLAVVGAAAQLSGGGVFAGAFVYEANTGQLVRTFTAPQAGPSSSLGGSVAISDGLVLAGDRFGTAQVLNSGLARVFDVTLNASVTNLLDPNPSTNSFFGDHVAVSGNDALVGGRDHKVIYFNARTGAVQPAINSPDAQYTLGSNFAVANHRALISATDAMGKQVGLVINLDSRQLVSVLRPTGPNVGVLGKVALDGNRAILGSPSDTNAEGAAYLFDVATGNQLARLANPTGPNDGSTRNAFFGTDVDVDGDLAVVGFPNYSERGLFTGGAFVYSATTGALLKELVASDYRVGDSFGETVAIEGNTVIVGATRNNAGATPGAAYIFAIPEPTTLPWILLGLLLPALRRPRA